MTKHLITILIGCMGCWNSLAQETSDQQGEVEDAQVLIEKDKIIKLPPADRQYEEMVPMPTPPSPPSPSYSFSDFPYQVSYLDPRIRMLGIRNDPVEKNKDNYLKFGYGNFNSPYLEGYFNNTQSEDFLLGLHAKHLSSGSGPVDRENSATSQNLIELDAKTFREDAYFNGHLGYQRDKYHFYGYQQSLDVNKDTIQQTFNQFSMRFGLGSGSQDSNTRFAIGSSFNYLLDDFEASELALGLDGEVSFILTKQLQFSTSGELFITRNDDSIAIDRNFLRIKPLLTYRAGLLKSNFGINGVWENDTIQNGNKLHLYPWVELEYQFSPFWSINGGIKGGMERNSLAKFVGENPYLAPKIQINNTNQKWEIFGNIHWQTNQPWWLEIRGSFGHYQNLRVFANSALDSTKFEVLYDQGTTSRLNLFAEFGYTFHEVFSTSIHGEYFVYKTDQIFEPWQLPEYLLAWSGKYQLSNELVLESDLTLIGGIKALNLQSGNTTQLEAIVDLSFKIEYLFNPRASAFIQIENLLSQDYERYWNYPVRGIRVLGGLTFSF